jgi:hypothetical protein
VDDPEGGLVITLQLDAVGFDVVKASDEVVVVAFHDPASQIKVVVPFPLEAWEKFMARAQNVTWGVVVAPAAALGGLPPLNGQG